MSMMNKAGQTEWKTVGIFRALQLIWEGPTLGNLAPLVSSCSLLVSNVTAVSQLVAALETPSLVLFSAPKHDRREPVHRFLYKTLQSSSIFWTAEKVLLQAERNLKEVHSHA
jgi:ADP-heptose:LPS heptosyltransferase